VEGTFCIVAGKVHLNRSLSQRTSHWRNLVDTLSKCEAQTRFVVAAAIREKSALPETGRGSALNSAAFVFGC